MMARIARVVLTESRGAEELISFTFDLVLNQEGHVINKAPTAGWLGSFASGSSLEPFILLPNGKLDFGSEYEIEDRFGTTNIHSKTIAVGEYVSVTTNSGGGCLRITKIVWLDELN
jgi:hypothetical protein